MDPSNANAIAVSSTGSCEIGAVLEGQDQFVCLGPGTLCKGGEFIGGSGAKPLCRYPTTVAGYAVLLTIISILMFFERLKHMLIHTVPRSYLPVMNAMFGELSSLGFVSLVAFFFEFEPPGMMLFTHRGAPCAELTAFVACRRAFRSGPHRVCGEHGTRDSHYLCAAALSTLRRLHQFHMCVRSSPCLPAHAILH